MIKLFKSKEEKFLEAIEKKDSKKVQKLLKKGVNPNYKKDKLSWPLINACWSGNSEIASLLLAYGADINAQNDYGLSGLHWAAEKGFTDIAKILIDAKININLATKEHGNTAIISAALNGQYEIVNILIKAGSDINYKNYSGNSAILAINKNNIPEILQLLIDNGANVNDTNNDKWTPLHYFCRDNEEKAVKILLDYKAEINRVNNKGWTPLMLSVHNDNDAITELLLNNKADLEPVNDEGHSVLELAIIKGNNKSVSLLLEHGADFYHREKNNGRLLIDVAYNSKVDALKKIAVNYIYTLYNPIESNNIVIINEILSGNASAAFLNMVKAELLLRTLTDDSKEYIEVLLTNHAIKALTSYSAHKSKILETAVQKGNIKLAKMIVDEFEDLYAYALILAEDNKVNDLYDYVTKIKAQKEEERKKKGASDTEMIKVLKELCRAYAANDSKYLSLEPKARQIGENLNEAGGLAEMRRIFSSVEGTPGSRTLEMHWNGIGDWRG